MCYRTKMKLGLVMTSYLTLLMTSSTHQFNPDDCANDLGMESGRIRDEHISASSSYNTKVVGPHTARLNKEIDGGAWCPLSQISKDTHEYLEVDLNDMKVVTYIETQGRFGNGRGREYAEMYVLEYWRKDLPGWIRFKDHLRRHILKGNTNTYTKERRVIDPPIIAHKIRIIPYSEHVRTVCMRIELHGCNWTEGIISYSAPVGDERSNDIDLRDKTYDGIIKDGYVTGGLGQLTDGQTGPDDFRVNSSGHGKGYEWVGWKNDSNRLNPLEFTFEFDSIRNFSYAKIYANNMFTKDTQVFSKLTMSFSVEGNKYTKQRPITFTKIADTYAERSRFVHVHLKNRIGKFVKMQFTFPGRWLLLSELAFESVPVEGNFTDDEIVIEGNYTDEESRLEEVAAQSSSVTPVLTGDTVNVGNQVNPVRNEDTFSKQYVSLIIGILGALIVVLGLVIVLITRRKRRRKQNNNHTMLKPIEKRVTINMKVALEDPYSDKSSFYHDTSSHSISSIRKLPDIPTSEYTDSGISREYAVPDLSKCGPPPPLSSSVPLIPRPPPLIKLPLDQHYAATDVIKVPSIQGVSGNTVYAVPNTPEWLSAREKLDVSEFPRERLHFVEKLGEGQFGEVHLCKAEGMPELVDVPCYEKSSMLVAVKILRKNANDTARNDFFKEIKILSKLRDPNIVHVLGMCTTEEPLCMIVEYMENGDLHQFLQEHVPEPPSLLTQRNNVDNTLSYGCLIYVATQIASGMKHLESLNFVHRDLAARNCLVGNGYTIKIADFGMSRSLYNSDYYGIEGRAVLPIRWMAWESILMGKFTTKSDVWSFAVTLWEILTFSRQQPYESLSDEKVIENVGRFYNNDGFQIYLQQPMNCPKEIYDLMCECWQRNETQRPNFREIHLFLQRKNLGYEP